MKTIEEIKNEVAKEQGYKNFNHACMNMDDLEFEEFMKEVNELFSNQQHP